LRNAPDQRAYFSDNPTSSDYLKSINYELDYLTHFAGEMDEKDILILIGDHQPPIIASPSDGSDTMIHILSKNREFIRSFYKYGFSQGLKCREVGDGFSHKDILWPLVTEITQAYGQ